MNACLDQCVATRLAYGCITGDRSLPLTVWRFVGFSTAGHGGGGMRHMERRGTELWPERVARRVWKHGTRQRGMRHMECRGTSRHGTSFNSTA
eukprot:317496-Chlamydomonas_euryale.AAC.3